MIDYKGKKIWVLDDGRAGNTSQSVGLAAAMSKDFNVKSIKYKFFIFLPNCIRSFFNILAIHRQSKKALKNGKPDIVIAAGRRLAPISLYLKKLHPEVFLIHIMKPNLDFAKFDVLVLPEHDIRDSVESLPKNIITSVGALSKVQHEMIKKEAQQYNIKSLKRPLIALLVGGSTKKKALNMELAQKMGKKVSQIAHDMKAELLVSTSRRTPKDSVSVLKQSLNVPCHFYDWRDSDIKNPYFAYLGLADYIIVTGDSLSMCSEACSLGKPVYIYSPEGICADKHLRMHKSLFNRGCARQLNDDIKILEDFAYTPLNETSRVANLLQGKEND